MRRSPGFRGLRQTRAALVGSGAILVFGCATAPASDDQTGTAPRGGDSVAVADTTAAGAPRAPAPPASPERSTGYLDWEDLGVRMVGEGPTAGLRIDVTTLDEEAIELASDDVRTYFTDLKRKIPDAVPSEIARETTPFLVGYTGFEKEVRFDPSRLEIRSEGSTLYPRYVIPVSGTFDRRIVGIHETVYGIYLFDGSLDLLSTLEFRYDNITSGTAWRNVVERIQRAKTQRRSSS